MLRGLSRSADGLIPVLLIGAIISLVVLGVGAFKSPAYRGRKRGGLPRLPGCTATRRDGEPHADAQA